MKLDGDFIQIITTGNMLANRNKIFTTELPSSVYINVDIEVYKLSIHIQQEYLATETTTYVRGNTLSAHYDFKIFNKYLYSYIRMYNFSCRPSYFTTFLPHL